LEELAAADARVVIVDLPKHKRRGEPHRHRVLSEQATGRVVAYLCDRDLWLPTHLEELTRVLDGGADLAYTLRFDVTDAGVARFRHTADLSDAGGRVGSARRPSMPLSFVGHTLDAYRRLPHGWRTTPEGTATDNYMWKQFLDQPWVRVGSSPMPTVLYFKRGDHPGRSTVERLELLEQWAPRALSPEDAAVVQREVLAALWRRWADLQLSSQGRRVRLWRRAARVLRRWFGAR
jgi:hypothetical protein